MNDKNTTEWLATLMNGDGEAERRSFTPVAQYYPEMDNLLYLTEDCSYRADRVDVFLTLLWHPQEDRAVGIKLKGFRFLFQRVRSILDLKAADFVPVAKALEIAMVGGIAEAIMNRAAQERIQQSYAEARKITGDARLAPASELLAAAA